MKFDTIDYVGEGNPQPTFGDNRITWGFTPYQWRREEGEGACAPGGTVPGAVFGEIQYWILKDGRFGRIGVWIAYSDILHPFNTSAFFRPHHLTVIAPPHTE